MPDDDNVGDLKLKRKHTKELNHKEWNTNISLSLDKKEKGSTEINLN